MYPSPQPHWNWPPQPPRRRSNWPLIVILLIIALIVAISTTVLFYLKQNPSASLGLLPTSTAANSLYTSNFSQFLHAFSLVLQEKDYATLQTVVDTQNFQAMYMVPEPEVYAPSNPGPYNWQVINRELVTGRISFVLSSPLLTADQAGYASCFGYTQTGITAQHIEIDAQSLQYIVGTLKPGPGYFTSDPEWTTNSTVFVFELPDTSSPTWLWRAVTFNNSLGCG